MRYVSNHSMRHLNASLLINAGVDVKTVQSCLGHSTPTTTLSIYLHTFQSAQAAAMEAVSEALPLSCSSDTKTV
jgi:site-specific recombinase XerD